MDSKLSSSFSFLPCVCSWSFLGRTQSNVSTFLVIKPNKNTQNNKKKIRNILTLVASIPVEHLSLISDDTAYSFKWFITVNIWQIAPLTRFGCELTSVSAEVDQRLAFLSKESRRFGESDINTLNTAHVHCLSSVFHGYMGKSPREGAHETQQSNTVTMKKEKIYKPTSKLPSSTQACGPVGTKGRLSFLLIRFHSWFWYWL